MFPEPGPSKAVPTSVSVVCLHKKTPTGHHEQVVQGAALGHRWRLWVQG